ncbi:MAG TPA: hypothetical protein VFS10_01880 [Pyrinomonadaceae bacterium]|nr:hypothetical protein [Pyrinomonadaceae bacterium]
MSEDATTKPTIETVLERVNALGEKIDGFRDYFETRFSSFRNEVEIRLDRIESMTNQTRAEMLTLRADFKEISAHIRQTT